MRLRVLVDNNTYIDRYFLGEPALSFYIENKNDKILFDTGYSDAFIQNADKMNIDLTKVKKIVFSHGHSDHTGGLKFLIKKMDLKDTDVFACDGCFDPKESDLGYIGSPVLLEDMKRICSLHMLKAPVEISENIMFLGRIPEYFAFEKRYCIGVKNNTERDFIFDDSALACKTDEGIFIVTGCSHSGICNIIEHAVKVCGDERIAGVIGGFHLFEENDRLFQTIEYFKSRKIKRLYPCHCVSFKAKCAVNSAFPVQEVGAGMDIEF
ncbi:MBL fold metallo-hydrolase [Lachnospiraceae bacterium NSJ-143]|nr:MBL fold metallo-hydrolase [Lachnospiraceae bacterium NSJ-143]